MRMLLVALCLAMTPALPAERHGNFIVMSNEEAKDCDAGGGCQLITNERLKYLLALEARQRT